jgi:hypothetical protein
MRSECVKRNRKETIMQIRKMTVSTAIELIDILLAECGAIPIWMNTYIPKAESTLTVL